MHALPLSRPSRLALAALAALCLVSAPARAATTFVKDVMVIGDETKNDINSLKNTYTNQGWRVIDYDLNKGAGGDYIYLLYKGVDIPGANASYDLVTGFYLKSDSGSNPPASITTGGKTYYLAPYAGGSHFTGRKGDLNSNAEGDTIHLYYTKDPVQAGYAVSSIVFNDSSSGNDVVCKDSTTTPYDLNKGCGSGTADIYMHVASSIVTYPITYDTAGGSTPNNPSTYNVETTTFTLNNPTRNGYTFAGWTGSNGSTAQTTVTIAKGSTGVKSYTANWTLISYSINYTLAGGALPSGTSNPDSYTIETATFTLPQPTRNGYTFAGWTGSNGSIAQTSVSIAKGSTGNKSYTANWTPVTYSITYNTAGGSLPSGTSNPGSYTIETATFTLPQPSRNGYRFTGWTGSNGSTAQTSVSVTQGSTGNRTYTANWTPIFYDIAYDLDYGSLPGGTSNPSTYCVTNAAITLVNPVRTGHTFTGWSGTDLSSTTKSVTIPAGSYGARSYLAHWTRDNYSIAYNLGNGASLPSGTSNPTTYHVETDTFTLNNPSRTGYTFAGWTGSNGTMAQTTVTIAKGTTGNKSYTANWTPVDYSISYTLDGGALPDNHPTSYNIESAAITLVNPTRDHYAFAGWTWSGQTTPQTTVTIAHGSTGDKSYTANWTPVDYSIGYDLAGGELPVGASNPTNYNIESAAITLVNPARTGYAFDGWTGSNGSTPQTSVTIAHGSTGDKSYAANWTPISYTVRFDANGGTGSMIDQSFTYDAAQNLRANTFTRTGYNYAGWSATTNGAVLYADGASVSNLAATAGDVVTLHAVWNKTAWRELQDQFDAGGTVTLAGDVAATAVDAPLIVTNAVVLDLAGHTLADCGIGYVIVVDNGGVLTLTNSVPDAGAIVGVRYGIDVLVDQGGAFTMDGGAITGDGTGVLVGYPGAAFTMNGGAITNNGKSGVYVYAGSFTLNGGEISGNSAADNGAGVYIRAGCTMTVSGSPVVSGNVLSAGGAANVFLEDGATIAVGALAAGASIGVTTATAPTDGHPVVFTSGAALADVPFFFGDDPDCFVGMRNGELCLATAQPTPWERLQWRLDEGGTVALAEDVAAVDGDVYLVVTNAVTLDLAGHTLRHNGNKEAIHVTAGGDLTLTNSVEGAGAVTGGGDHGVYVGNNAVFRLQAGAISGNFTGYGGGGVFVNEGGAFEMTGGAITDNIATNHAGGGVFVYKGSFTMSGGTISGNPAGFGGGVYVGDRAIFAMNGGTIADNSASGGDGGGGVRLNGGGGVYVAPAGSFAMNGGAITDNTATRDGGGVEVSFGGLFSVSGSPVVSGNTAGRGVPSNVRLPPEVAMWIGALSEGASIGVTTYERPDALHSVVVATGAAAGDGRYFFSDFSPYLVAEAGGEIRLEAPDSPWGALQLRLAEGGTVALTNDVAALDYERALQITNAVTLDLNGHTLTGSTNENVLLIDSGGRLLLTNSAPASGSVTGGGGVYVSFGGEFLMAGGTIAGCGAGDGHGAGVYVSFDGSFTMSGGTIRGNAAERGAGVYVSFGGSFTMAGGEISGNSAEYGGGVYVDCDAVFTLDGGEISGNSAEYGGGVYVDCDAVFTLDGGAISGNAATNPPSSWDGALGGGVYLAGGGSYDDNGTYAMNGGTICSNVAECGGGVYVGQKGSFSIGDGEISGNRADWEGGGVYSGGWAELSMSGGTISGNSAYDGGGVAVLEGGLLTMTGGAIAGNTASENGGGVLLAEGSLLAAGGTISGNSAGLGGGVAILDGGMAVSGSPVISNNTGFVLSARNVLLSEQSGRIFVSNLTAGASIGVMTSPHPDWDDPVAFAEGAEAGDEACFFSDDPAYSVEAGNGGELRLVQIRESAWNLLQARLDAGGEIALEESVFAPSYGSPSLVVTNEVVLDLAGHDIAGALETSVFRIGDGGILTLTNSVEGAGSVTCGWSFFGGGVHVGSNGVFLLRGGAISGNYAGYGGGGVCVDAFGAFEMTGGEVSGNAADGGGGVFVFGGDGPGVFTMSGGTISGNVAGDYGGGVYVDWDAVFTLAGGAITGNAVGEYGEYGGVVVFSSGFTVSGAPVVSGNIGRDGKASNVCLSDRATIAVDGLEAGARIGATTYVEPADDDPVVFSSGATFDDAPYFFSDDPAFFVGMANGELCLATAQPTPWTWLQYRLDAGGTVRLAEDMAAADGDEPLWIHSEVVLDLAGHTLTGLAGERVLNIGANGFLTLTNSVPERGAITGGFDDDGGGVFVFEGGLFTMDGGAIAGCVADEGGGGVYVDDGGEFVMNGGAISGNEACYGGGVYVNDCGWFTMNGGAISGNRVEQSRADDLGGGVYVRDGGHFIMEGGAITGNSAYYCGGGVYVDMDASFLMAGGEISGNTVRYIAGGGVYVEECGEFAMVGGTVSGNAAESGGGVYVEEYGRMNVWGSPVVAGNTNAVGAASNVSLTSERPISILELEAGASIGVTTRIAPEADAPVAIAYGAGTGDRRFFFSDDPDFLLAEDPEYGAVFLRVALDSPWEALQRRLDAGGLVTLSEDVVAVEGDDPLLVAGAVALDLNGHTLAFNGNGSVFEIVSGGDLVLSNGVPATGAVTGGDAEYGGGVFVFEGGSFTMDGGAITGCVAGLGAGVYVADGGAFAMNGGTITENDAPIGGGVAVGYGGTMAVSGSPVVAGNGGYFSEESNVLLGEGVKIAVGGLSAGASIGVTPGERPTVFEPVFFTDGAAAGDIAHFFGDMPEFPVEERDGELCFAALDTPWTALQIRLLGGGVVALTNDVAATLYDGPLVVTNAVVLDLAGHSLFGPLDERAIYIDDGGRLTLTNSVPDTGAITGPSVSFPGGGGGIGGGIGGEDPIGTQGGGDPIGGEDPIGGGGSGMIIGPTGEGSGVYVADGGVFTMDGGAIAGCSSAYGGGVCVEMGGAFTMNAGTISGNSARVEGGGVYVETGAAFTVSGAPVVAGNVVSPDEENNVYLCLGADIAVAGLSEGAAIGVSIDAENARLAPLPITDGAAPGDIARFSSDDPGLALTLLANGEIGLRVPLTWALLQEMLDEGGAITLTDDCAASPDDRFLSVTTTVVLDLAGHTIMGNGRDHVFYVYDCGDLTLTNSAATGGAITGGGDVYSGGGVFVDGGAFTMDGGAITGCVANMYGGGVYVPDGTFTMNGGEIRDNAANHGGGVYVGVGTFTMNGGTIAGNTATNGAGVCGAFTMNGGEIRGNAAEEGGGGVYTWNRAFTMNGGTIAGNTATGGGGVRGPLAMNGGTITGNSALSSGGGVTAFMEEVVVSGSAVIAGNTNSLGGAANVYLIETTLAVGDLAPGASIGVWTYPAPAAGGPVAFATGASAGDAAYFFSDVSTNHVEFADGKLWLAQGVAYPAYLDGADDAVKANWVDWAGRYGAVTDAKCAPHFLLDIDPRTEIPADAELLKVTDFRLTDTDLHFEVASDVAAFTAKGTDGLMVGNGYLGVILLPSLSPGAPCFTNAPLEVTFRDGRAVYDAHAADTGSNQMPPSFFIRPIITDR